ncbi:helix-turn-helix domain-containing protein [Turicibacter sanguinis]|nr:helix-turn-helix domain-containing protein [Turicibacter sanguinis]MTO03098.1 helix-turn-helix domain-containing protein [Turicibacter sanguinis]MTO11773.1 helix-turn-helix domain-containing protein [Turicibacter sanguinis]MTO16814.1 helix-turn-helix domain-containing protein [Turicibacter sanguinis]MTO28383.1 helix-turn-helix domain-containing protein [Turicibacter sanguinis]
MIRFFNKNITFCYLFVEKCKTFCYILFGGEKMEKKEYHLKQLRARYGMTQEEVANSIGITRQHYALIEREEKRIATVKLETVILLSNLFSVDLNFFCSMI